MASSGVSQSTSHQASAEFTDYQKTPNITMPSPHFLRAEVHTTNGEFTLSPLTVQYTTNEELTPSPLTVQQQPLLQQNHIAAINQLRMGENYELAISCLEMLVYRDYIGFYLRGWLKFQYARSFPRIMTTMRVNQPGCCCYQPPPTIVPVEDYAATASKRNNLLRGCCEDLVYAFAASADIAGVDVKIRSDIAFSVAVVSQQLDDEKKIRAYVERAVELNPDNMDAKEAHVMHKTSIHNVGVYTTTNVKTIASATSSVTNRY
jgi:hypothetical protein